MPTPVVPPPVVPAAPAPTFPALETLTPGRTLLFSPSLTLAEEYTDNFSRSHRDARENFRTTVAPAFTVVLDRRPTAARLSYRLAAAHDTITDDDDVSLFHALLGEARWEASPGLTLSLADAFTHSDEPERADRLDLRRERRTFSTNTVSAGADYATATTATRGSYRLSWFAEEDGPETLTHTAGAGGSLTLLQRNTASLDYEYLISETSRPRAAGGGEEITGHRVNSSLLRQFTPAVSGGVSGSYSWRTQDRQLGPASDFNLWSVSLFGTYAVPMALSVSLSGGVSGLESDTGPDRTMFSGSATVSYQFARARASVSADQGFSESFATGENLGVVETRGVRATLTYAFSPFVTGSVEGSYRENEFTGVGTASARPSEETWRVAAALEIQLRQWLRLHLAAARVEGSSGDRLRNFTEHRLQAALTASF